MYPLNSAKVREYAFKDISSTAKPALGQAPLVPQPRWSTTGLCATEGPGQKSELSNIIHGWSQM